MQLFGYGRALVEPPVLCADVHYNQVTPLNLSQGNRQDMLFLGQNCVLPESTVV